MYTWLCTLKTIPCLNFLFRCFMVLIDAGKCNQYHYFKLMQDFCLKNLYFHRSHHWTGQMTAFMVICIVSKETNLLLGTGVVQYVYMYEELKVKFKYIQCICIYWLIVFMFNIHNNFLYSCTKLPVLAPWLIRKDLTYM